MKEKIKIKKRDFNVVLAAKREISLSTRTTKNKKKAYNRQKFKNKRFWD